MKLKLLFSLCLILAHLGLAFPLFALTTEISPSVTPSQTKINAPESQKTESRQDLPSESESKDPFEPGKNPEGRFVTKVQKATEVSQEPGLRLGIKDCIQMSLLNNREIKGKNYDIEIAEAKLSEAKPVGIPVLQYEFISAPAPRNVDDAVSSFFEGDLTYLQRGKIDMGIPLFSFGKLSIAQDLAQTGIAAAKEKKIEKQNDVVLKTKKLYYGILLAKDVEDLLQDAISHMDSEIKRRENGDQGADPVELVRLKLFRYEIIRRLTETQKKGYLAREGLRIQMGLEKPINFELLDSHLDPIQFDEAAFQVYLESSRKYRPERRLLDLGVKAKEDLYRLEKRKFTPDVGVGGFFEFGRTTNSIEGLALTDDFNDPFNFSRMGFGLRVKGEMNFKGYFSKVRQAQAEYFKTAMEKHAGEDGLELDLKEAYLSVIHAKQGVEDSEAAKKLARQFVFLTKTNMDVGVGDRKDYSDALQAYLVSRGRYLEAVYEYNGAVATLEQKAGGPAQPQ